MAQADIGLYGLGTMGSALALNLADHGFNVAVTNREISWISDFVKEAGALADRLMPVDTLQDFVASIAIPRTILFMIPSGAPMDAMIAQITPLLDKGDTIIDGGNADFNDTRRRSAAMAGTGLHFVGMGVSGGEEGARNGPSMMVGATTENPSFELNSAVLSRSQVLVLERLSLADLERIAQRAEQELGRKLPLDGTARENLLEMSDGDGRALLNLIEQVAAWKVEGKLDSDALATRLMKRATNYDKSGDEHYNLISALHKSVRGSDPDAALYWFARMLTGGEDPRFLARRILRMSVEDIGLADPQAQTVCLHAWETYERLGSPEGELALAQAVTYLALAPKSNAGYAGYKNAMATAKKTGSEPPPKHIMNAPTKLMKDQGYGDGYAYDHDAEDGFSGQNYFPEGMKRPVLYSPVERGFERELKRRLDYFAGLRAKRK